MTKSDLIERLAARLGLPKGRSEVIVNCVFDSMEEALRRGERIELRGFGSFELRSYSAYSGRNPRTGVPVEVHEKRLPFFRVGKEMKERINGDEYMGPETPAAVDDDAADEAVAVAHKATATG